MSKQNIIRNIAICAISLAINSHVIAAQKTDTLVTSKTLNGLKFRSIGPAFTSGRIADFAFNPQNYAEYYVAVASGHIWKTVNNGITFEPVFDNYGAYSIGCLAIDKNNPNVVWAGTGENNHQRVLGYGNGVWATADGGQTWQNMGLKNARQIGMIQIDPTNSQVVYVAAEGSAWGPGGDRGLYKTTDGGKNWKKVLEISENTGINNVLIDPRYHNIIYATSEQRRRHVQTKIGGGPESGIHKSEDGGLTWKKLTTGLPTEHMGGIGIAISPQNPDVLYAIIEAAYKDGGFYRSENRGESWVKMSNHSSSGQYYNEIVCDPVQFDKIYSTETFSHFTIDGGKTWQQISTKDRHVDDHAFWVDPTNKRHWLIGGDGGIYESYDMGENWLHKSNLSVTQFYRVTADNALPFYNVYGGTQDNATLGGPSRNISNFGVTAGEWFVTVFGDGFWSRVDPTDPNIVYSEWQYGNIVRYDKKSGEKVIIKPVPGKNEETYKWNWNTPIVLSHHQPTTLYMAANKVFKSNDRGNSWTTISGDLTTQTDRNTWPVMGKYWSSDAVVKDVSTSLFGTIVSLEESPLKAGLLYAGTDDGLIQVTQDDGQNWTKVEGLKGIPENTYVSDILASKFNENIVFASFDNHQRDDFAPYIYKSSDNGKTWVSIVSNLPKNGMVHTIEQDNVNENLLFVGTEFGVFASLNGGTSWVQLKAGLPDIAVKDLALQTRETDLVIATFGRGIYILDDYSPLRTLTEETAKQNAILFGVKDALLYVQTDKIYGQGATYYGGQNPAYGATFTYYLNEVQKTAKQTRLEQEKVLFEQGKPIKQLSISELERENLEPQPYIRFTIYDAQKQLVRVINSAAQKGISRVNWDLRYPDSSPLKPTLEFDPLRKTNSGIFVMPGAYTVNMHLVEQGINEKYLASQKFVVKPLNNTTLPAIDREKMVAFQHKVSELTKQVLGAITVTEQMLTEVITIKQALLGYPDAKSAIELANQTEAVLRNLQYKLKGDEPKASFEELPPANLAIEVRLNDLIYAQIESTSDITTTSEQSYQILMEQVPPIVNELTKVQTQQMVQLHNEMNLLKAPYSPGRTLKWE